ncbi:glycosyltransferase family 9 protein [Gallaecimonas kandeliae]|uniref:glycosyltransferase family 9 protein n=1 Tax=Gallaecimonas kandeliae TaxID=3029055 RepID=UPI002649EB0F|nr:glycosyltransferase family 9 protein [Gallaecimonas kandeliae]WKE64781.1 glycosyltransferase family 9 protein [Gallaecimonas kandeliae]
MKKLKSYLRQFDKARRSKDDALEALLLKLLARCSQSSQQPLEPAEVKKVLILRSNKRIGNMLFLIPFVRQVQRNYPGAQVDLLLHQPWQASLFEGLGLNHIYSSRLSLRRLWSLVPLLRDLRKQRYDLLLMPYSSATDTCLAAFIHGRNKAARQHGQRHIVFPQSVSVPPQGLHAALASLPLLGALGCDVAAPDHHLALSAGEQLAGTANARQLRCPKAQVQLAFFRGARGSKQIADAQWQALLAEVERQLPLPVQWVEILSPDIPAPLLDKGSHFQCRDFRQLGATLAAMDGFICADTGPLHLADAAGARCFGLFNETDPAIFGCLGTNCHNLWFQGDDDWPRLAGLIAEELARQPRQEALPASA